MKILHLIWWPLTKSGGPFDKGPLCSYTSMNFIARSVTRVHSFEREKAPGMKINVARALICSSNGSPAIKGRKTLPSKNVNKANMKILCSDENIQGSTPLKAPVIDVVL